MVRTATRMASKTGLNDPELAAAYRYFKVPVEYRFWWMNNMATGLHVMCYIFAFAFAVLAFWGYYTGATPTAALGAVIPFAMGISAVFILLSNGIGGRYYIYIFDESAWIRRVISGLIALICGIYIVTQALFMTSWCNNEQMKIDNPALATACNSDWGNIVGGLVAGCVGTFLVLVVIILDSIGLYHSWRWMKEYQLKVIPDNKIAFHEDLRIKDAENIQQEFKALTVRNMLRYMNKIARIPENGRPGGPGSAKLAYQEPEFWSTAVTVNPVNGAGRKAE